jgi:Fungal specific transcription factor domain
MITQLPHARLGQGFEYFLYGGIKSSQERVPVEPAQLPPFTNDKLEISLSKREEVLNLLAEIQSVYENRSLEINTALSLEEMQEYLSLFVQKFNLSYPLIHIPTLEVAKTESILLLSMIILGASYKTKDSHRMSVSLYDAIVPYILSGLTSIPVPTLSTLQAFMILECYGMYRAGPYQREMAMLIHTLLFNVCCLDPDKSVPSYLLGLLVQTIRRISRYHVRGGIMLPKHLKHPRNWEEFSYAEQYKRYCGPSQLLLRTIRKRTDWTA